MIEDLGSKRLLIRFSQPDHDGQVQTPEHRRDAGADNEIDGDDAIKLYDELVKSPEDRLALEKEIPSLVAARDQSGHSRKTETTAEETAQKRDHIAKMHR